jgi:hypothetical protein
VDYRSQARRNASAAIGDGRDLDVARQSTELEVLLIAISAKIDSLFLPEKDLFGQYHTCVKQRIHRRKKLRRIASGEFEPCAKVRSRWLKVAAALFVIAFFVVLQQAGAFEGMLSRAKTFARVAAGRPLARPTFADDHVLTDVPTSLDATQARRLYEVAVAGLNGPAVARESALTVAVSPFLDLGPRAKITRAAGASQEGSSTRHAQAGEISVRRGMLVAKNEAREFRQFRFPAIGANDGPMGNAFPLPSAQLPSSGSDGATGSTSGTSGKPTRQPPHTSKGPVSGPSEGTGIVVPGDTPAGGLALQVVPEPHAAWLFLLGTLPIGWKILRRRAAN